MLLAIDPGKDTGWALFGLDGRLLAAGVCDGDNPHGFPYPLGPLDTVIAEEPWYRKKDGRPRKGDATPQDLITLSVRLGRVLGKLGDRHTERRVFPHEWKGELPKPVSEARTRKRLDREETRVAIHCAARYSLKVSHNMWDAIGLGLFGLGRSR